MAKKKAGVWINGNFYSEGTDRVYDIDGENADFIKVQFKLNGETVIGMYERFGWAWGPEAVREETRIAMSRLPIATYGAFGARRRKRPAPQE